MKIVTKPKTNAKGDVQIVAKGGGKQKTVTVDPAHSEDRSHGSAAGDLGLVLGLEWHADVQHEANDDGSHTFIL
jgi:hypothetical protein